MEVHKQKQWLWAMQHIGWTVEDWKWVIFSDESKFMLFKSDRCQYCYVKPGQALDDHFVKKKPLNMAQETWWFGGVSWDEAWEDFTASRESCAGRITLKSLIRIISALWRTWNWGRLGRKELFSNRTMTQNTVPRLLRSGFGRKMLSASRGTFQSRYEYYRAYMGSVGCPRTCSLSVATQQEGAMDSSPGGIRQLPPSCPGQTFWEHALLHCCVIEGPSWPHQILITSWVVSLFVVVHQAHSFSAQPWTKELHSSFLFSQFPYVFLYHR